MSTIMRTIVHSPCRLRKAEAWDLSALEAIDRDAFPDVRRISASEFALLHDQGWTITTAVSHNEPAQVLGYVISGMIGRSVRIERFAVALAERRRRIGQTLILDVVANAVRTQAALVETTVSERDHLPAQCLLRQCHFRVPRAGVNNGLFHFVRPLTSF